MLKFANLSLAQKRFVVAAVEANPNYSTNPNITLKECSTIYDNVRLAREGKKGEKIGYPNWLFANNKIERGLYELPVPTEEELNQFQLDLEAKLNPVKKAKAKVAAVAKATKNLVDNPDIVTAQDMEEFNQLLAEHGIAV